MSYDINLKLVNIIDFLAAYKKGGFEAFLPAYVMKKLVVDR